MADKRILESVLAKLRNLTGSVETPDSILNKFWSSKISNPLIGAQKFIENPARISFGKTSEYNPQHSALRNAAKIPFEIYKGAAEDIAGTIVKIPPDIGRAIGSVINKDTENFKPASAPLKFGMNLGEYAKGKKPLDNVGYKGGGDWTVPFTKIKMPEFGLTESNAYETAKLGLEAFEGPLALTGIKNPQKVVGMLGFSGFLGGAFNYVGTGGEKDSFTEGALATMIDRAPSLAKSAGLLSSTDKFVEGLSGIKALPIKSAANVFQGVAYDNVSGQETTGASIFIDALFPVAQLASKEVFKTFNTATRRIQAGVLDNLGKKLRKSDGTYTSLAKFVKNTRPYRKGGAGAFLGFEITQDEDGNWKVGFDKDKALLGIALMSGGTKVLDSIDSKFLGGMEVPPIKETITDKVSRLKNEIESDKGFDETLKNIEEFEDSSQKVSSLKAASDKKLALGEEARRKGFEAYDAHKAGNMELRDTLNAEKQAALSKLDNLNKAKSTISDTPLKTPPKEDLSFKGKVDSAVYKMENVYPSRKSVAGDSAKAQEAFSGSLKDINDSIGVLSADIQKSMGNDLFVDMVEGAEVPKEYESLVGDYKRLISSIKDFSEKDMGNIDLYFPHDRNTFGQSENVQLFGDVLIDKLNLRFGHAEARLDKMGDYSRDVQSVLEGYAQQAVYSKYGDYIGTTVPEQEILASIKGVESTDYTGFDYVDRLNSLAPEQKEITHKLPTLGILSMNLTHATLDREFREMGDEDLFSAWRNIRDTDPREAKDYSTLKPLVAAGEQEKVIDYFVKRRKISVEDTKAFVDKSNEIIQKKGLGNYADAVTLRTAVEDPRQIFLDTVKGYKFTDDGTKRMVNAFIESELAHTKYTRDALDVLNDVMVMAHIGGNVKTAVMQPLEALTLPVHFGLKNTAAGLWKSFTEGERLQNDYYGSGKMRVEFQVGAKGDVGGGKLRTLRDKLMSLTGATEGWKNRAFMGAAESKGLEDGMEQGSEQLGDYVRDQVTEHGHPATTYNTPEMLQHNSLLRTVYLYSQFSLKSTFEIYDTAKDGDLAAAGALALIRIATMIGVAKLVGSPVKYALQNMIDITGPIFTLPGQFFSYYMDAENAENPVSKDYYRKKMVETGVRNLVPGGTQFMKTGTYLNDLSQGWAKSPSGEGMYPVMPGLLNTSAGVLFGRGATSERKKYYGEGMVPLSENQTKLVDGSDDRLSTYQTILGILAGNKEKTKLKTSMEKDGVTSSISGDAIFYLDNNGKAQELKIKSKPIGDAEIYKWKKDAYASSLKVLALESITDEEKSDIYEKMGLEEEDIQYYSRASEDAKYRLIVIKEELNAAQSKEEMFTILANMRKEVGGKMVLTSGIIDDLVDEGYLSKEEGKVLKDFSMDSEGTPKVKLSGRGSGAKLSKVKIKSTSVGEQKIAATTKAKAKTPTAQIKFSTPKKMELPTMKTQAPKYKVNAPEYAQAPKYKVKFNV